MTRSYDGIVFTNDNCIACNKCISECPILGANVCSVKNGKKIVNVNANKCNHCGTCVSVCLHDARKFKDDTQTFFDAIKNGEKISLIVDQTFYVLYADKAPNVIYYLKSIGVDKIYDVAYGAEISLWAHIKYLLDNQNNLPTQKAFIANTCSSFVNEVELYNPNLLRKIIPVQSPAICTAIYAKKYLGDKNKIAFLNSCISRKDEISSPDTFGNIDYNLTYFHFSKHLDLANIPNLTASSDLKTDGIGNVLCVEGTFKDAVAQFFPITERFVNYTEVNPLMFDQLDLYLNPEYAKNQPLLAEIYGCRHACQTGPAFVKNIIAYPYINTGFDKIFHKCVNSITDGKSDFVKNRERFNSYFEELEYDDFKATFTHCYRQPNHVPQEIFEDIFNSMFMDTEEKRRINCGACGYQSCHDMAKAIAFGYNRKENCIHYMNEITEKTYYTDLLTGLDNQNGITRRVEPILAQNIDKVYAVCVGNVNRLRIINDVFSFEKGNEVLKYIAKVLVETVGNKGFVARIGGGLFCLFLEHDIENLQRIKSIKYFDCSNLGIEMPITMRFGISTSERFDETFVELLNRATLCMDSKSSTVHNTYTFFTQENREELLHEAEVTSQLPNALENKEFVLYFQPQYKTGSEELIGAESLVRWIKSDGTIVPPDSFIPIAEKNGFIVSLDQIIWRMAFESVRKWLNLGIKVVPISVNISRVSMETDALIYAIKRLDDEFKIPHNLIHFEVTESANIGDTATLVERIQKIRDLGYEIAMDDFGSGYSSLNSLKDFPIDIIKLDMGFFKVKDSTKETNNKGGNIVTSVVQMAHALQLITIAEGVENESQARFLTSIGCDIIQGFYYSKPIPEEEFVFLMERIKTSTKVEKPRIFGSIDVNSFYNSESGESLMFEEFSGPAVIFEFDEKEFKAKLIRVNKKALSLFEAQNLSVSNISNNLRFYFNAENRQIILETMQKAIDSQSEEVCTFEAKKIKTKSPIWVEIHLWNLSNNVNKHTMYCLMNDVSEKNISENTLEISNAQMGTLLNANAVGSTLIHLELDFRHPFESVKMRFLKVNSQFLDMTGFDKEKVLSWTEKDAISVVHPLDRPIFLAKGALAIRNHYKKPYTCVYRARVNDGTYRKVKIIASAIPDSKNSYFLAVNYTILNNDAPLSSFQQDDDEKDFLENLEEPEKKSLENLEDGDVLEY